MSKASIESVCKMFRTQMLSLKDLAIKVFSTKPRILGAAAAILVLILALCVFGRKEPTAEPAEATVDVMVTEPTTEPTVPETQPAGVPATMGIIITDQLNIHKDAGADTDIVDQYIKGDRVEIHETKNVGGTLWGYSGKGWISMGYVRMDDVPPGIDDPTNSDGIERVSNGSHTVLGYGVVDLRTLNVRAGPGTNYAVVKEIPQGIRHAYYEESGEWVRIGDGWVSTSFFYIEGTTAEDATTGTITTDNLNVRSGPDTDFRRLNSYMKDDSVQILAVVNGWGYTEKGWISMMYVELPEPVYTTGSATVTIGLNIREEPNADSDKVDAYREGDHITILEVTDGWGRTDKGWINLDYVKYD